MVFTLLICWNGIELEEISGEKFHIKTNSCTFPAPSLEHNSNGSVWAYASGENLKRWQGKVSPSCQECLCVCVCVCVCVWKQESPLNDWKKVLRGQRTERDCGFHEFQVDWIQCTKNGLGSQRLTSEEMIFKFFHLSITLTDSLKSSIFISNYLNDLSGGL